MDLGKASIPAVKQYLKQAEREGLDITMCLAKAQITDDVLQDNAALIPGCQFLQLLQSLITLSSNTLFGLHSGQLVEPSSYSVLGFMSLNCLTLGEALARVKPYEALVGDMGVTDFVALDTLSELPKNIQAVDDSTMLMSWACAYPDPSVAVHMVDNVLCSWLTFGRMMTQNVQHPLFVTLQRRAPSLAEQAEYQRVFQCAVYFEQPNNAIGFSRELLDTPLSTGNALIRNALEATANELLKGLHSAYGKPEAFEEEVRALIRQYLRSGKVRQDDIASDLQMSVKTLQRKLKLEGVSFQQLVDIERLDVAQLLLADASVSLMDISEQLGFTDVRSFYRYFNRLCGETPAQYRQALSQYQDQ